MIRTGGDQIEFTPFDFGFEVLGGYQGCILLTFEFIRALQQAQLAFEFFDDFRLMVESFLLEEITDAGSANE
jgi:hypothetical protein